MASGGATGGGAGPCGQVPRGDAARRAQGVGPGEAADGPRQVPVSAAGRKQERAEIEALKEEWRHKLEALEQRAAELDEKVVLAASNMNEVVFQKGLREH